MADDHERFLINRFREQLPYAEVPLKLHIRARTRGGEEAKEQIENSLEATQTRAAFGGKHRSH